MPQPLETQRLTLRPLQSNDYDFMRSLHLNRDVMKYIGGGVERTEAQTREIIEKYLKAEQETPSLGLWIVERRDTHEAIGNILLRKPATQEQTEGLEIGFSFLPEHWGKGYTPEASRRVMEYAYEQFGKIRIVALVNPENQTSKKVLTKLGFKMAGVSQYVDPSNGNVIPSELLEKDPEA